jgi:integrase/recombinase XerC/integrase/recombinase XerD
MRKTGLSSRSSEETLRTADIAMFGQNWILDGEMRQLSADTLHMRRFVLGKLQWFLAMRGYEECGAMEIRDFLAYAGRPHKEGRWGNANHTGAAKASSIRTYHRTLHAWFGFLVEEGLLSESPMATVKPPVIPKDQIQPFTMAQVEALLAAAKRSRHPARDEALVLLLLDTGARAGEACHLRIGDVDLGSRRCSVLGKGGKVRYLPIGTRAARGLWKAINERTAEGAGDDAYLFRGDAGPRSHEHLTENGLHAVVKRLGKAAGLGAVRCSPHTFRHTFAVEFLRAGGNVFTLKEILGHTSLTMTNRYVAIAQADIAAQHARFSPADRLRRK